MSKDLNYVLSNTSKSTQSKSSTSLDFISLNSSKTTNATSTSKDFFVIDCLPSPVTIEVDSVKHAPEKSAKDRVTAPNKRLKDTGSSAKKNLSGVILDYDDDDLDIIFEGKKASSFIPLNTSRKRLTKSPMSPWKVGCTQKRNYHTICSKCHKCKKPKKLKKSNTADSLRASLSELDDSIILISPTNHQSQSKDLSTTSKSGDPGGDPNIGNSDEDVVIEEVISDSSSPSSVEPDTAEILEKEDDYKSVPMEEDEETSDSLEINEEALDPNFIPVSTNLNDIEYIIDISEEILAKRHKLEKLRSWEWTKLGRKFYHNQVKPKGPLFKLLSYNVLSQKLLVDNKFLYANCNSDYLDWYYRWNLLQHEIKHIAPDILTLQEVESGHYYSHFLPWLKHLGFTGIYKKRTHEKPDGCAIFFKSDRFKLIEHLSVEYFQNKGGRILDRDNVGLMVKLSPVEFDQPFCIATTHLLYNPRRYDIKLSQLVLFLAELDRMCYNGESGGRVNYCPTVVTGDFNCEPHSTLMEFLRKGSLRYEGLSSHSLSQYGFYTSLLGSELLPPSLGINEHCQHAILAQSRFLENQRGQLFSLEDKRKIEEAMLGISHTDRSSSQDDKPSSQLPLHLNQGLTKSTGYYSHAFNFKSVYSHTLSRLRGAPEVTTNQNGWISVDYILQSQLYLTDLNDRDPNPLKLVSRYGLVSASEANYYGPLPSGVCPSDHFPLAAEFVIEKNS